MAFTKVTDTDRQGKGNVGQPDTPLLTTTEMQEQMDSLANLAIDKLNEHIDELAGTTAANSIGCQVPTGINANPNIGAIIQAIALEARQSVAARHVHSNKDALDTITTDLVNSINALIVLLSGIDYIESSLLPRTNSIPNSLAVKSYIDNLDYAEKVKDKLYPVGAIYQTTLVSPDSIFDTTDDWTLLSTDENGIKTYKRVR